MFISSQKQLEDALKAGETHLTIDGRDNFHISGSHKVEIQIADIGHLCFSVDEHAAPVFKLSSWAVAIFDVSGRARPLVQATDNAHAIIEARGQSSPRLELFGSSYGRIDCYADSSSRADISGGSILQSRVHGQSAALRIDAHDRTTVRHLGRGEIHAGFGIPIICDGQATVTGKGVRLVLPAIEVDLT